jgi:hypothetical protein
MVCVCLSVSVYCWGQDYVGQPPASHRYLQISYLNAGGSQSACGIRTESLSISCWSTATNGAVNLAGENVPPTVPGEFQTLAVGYRMGCAQRWDGSISCWSVTNSQDTRGIVL